MELGTGRTFPHPFDACHTPSIPNLFGIAGVGGGPPSRPPSPDPLDRIEVNRYCLSWTRWVVGFSSRRRDGPLGLGAPRCVEVKMAFIVVGKWFGAMVCRRNGFAPRGALHRDRPGARETRGRSPDFVVSTRVEHPGRDRAIGGAGLRGDGAPRCARTPMSVLFSRQEVVATAFGRNGFAPSTRFRVRSGRTRGPSGIACWDTGPLSRPVEPASPGGPAIELADPRGRGRGGGDPACRRCGAGRIWSFGWSVSIASWELGFESRSQGERVFPGVGWGGSGSSPHDVNIGEIGIGSHLEGDGRPKADWVDHGIFGWETPPGRGTDLSRPVHS
ncbi:hypothetical protein ElP_02050 [Tautonia plasticadhaerens]|uniref:Uncharacterized protein n=1 Tax=Tautonia plasticadhaerens TaxID=2527974 RepID=A0A518GUX1_9BACT|nr:hypothetical protein ElP_02050 [Tautonia plasticadhaerens]